MAAATIVISTMSFSFSFRKEREAEKFDQSEYTRCPQSEGGGM